MTLPFRSADALRTIRGLVAMPEAYREELRRAADYIDALEEGIDEQRRGRQRQLELRVEAEARAARLAKDARR